MYFLKQYTKKLLVLAQNIGTSLCRFAIAAHRFSDDTLKSRILKLSHALERRTDLEHEGSADFQAITLECLLKEVGNRRKDVDDVILRSVLAYAQYRWSLKCPDPSGVSETSEKSILTNNSGIIRNCVLSRRSVRLWNKRKVNIDDIKEIINVSKWAPSSCNRQPWKVKFLSEEWQKKELTNFFPKHFYTKADVILLVMINKDIYSDSERAFAYLDAGAFIQNILLLLHCKGHGACWVGFKMWDIYDQGGKCIKKKLHFHNVFSVPEYLLPVSLIAIGHPLKNPRSSCRKDISDIVMDGGVL